MTDLIRILFVEDFEDDAILIARRLGQHGMEIHYDIVDNAEQLIAILREKRHDIVLCDYNVPTMDAHRSLAIIRVESPAVPVIVVSGSIGEEQAADLMREGARDIVLKSNLSRLAPAIEREITGRDEQARLAARADQSERALDASERRYRQTFEEAPIAMGWISAESKYIRTNRALQELFGYTAEELAKMSASDTIHPMDRGAARQRGDAMRSGQVDHIQTESRHIRRDGQVIWLLINIMNIKADEGGLGYRLAHLQDITGRKTAESQLFHAQKMEAIGSFAGGIAHDFNNMLVPIIGLTETVKEDLPVDHPSQESLDVVLDAAAKARNLVQQILTFSRQDETRIDAIDLSSCIRGTVHLLRNMLPATITIRDSIQQDVGIVMADAAQLHSIVLNLGSNAAAAIGPKIGDLRLDLTRVNLDEHRGQATRKLAGGCYAKLSVADSGSGMSESTLAKIFDPFFTTKAPGEGTGLGLSMVHGIVERYGGAIDVTSRIGAGTRFDIYLPIVAAETQQAELWQSENDGENLIN